MLFSRYLASSKRIKIVNYIDTFREMARLIVDMGEVCIEEFSWGTELVIEELHALGYTTAKVTHMTYPRLKRPMSNGIGQATADVLEHLPPQEAPYG